MRTCVVLIWLLVACDTPPTPPAVASATAVHDAAPSMDARCVRTPSAIVAPVPPEQSCPAPSPAEQAAIERSMTAELGRDAAFEVHAICAERGGWLAQVTAKSNDLITGPWLVPNHGHARQLAHWKLGPTYDFDGDGRPDASTIGDGGEIKVWLAGDAHPSYLVDANARDGQWAAWDDKVVFIDGALMTWEFAPDHVARELVNTGAALVSAATSTGCAPAPPPEPARPATTAPTPPPGFGPQAPAARCVQLADADKARQALAIAYAVLHARDPDGVDSGVDVRWGCTSHGDTPVLVGYARFADATTTERWTIHDGVVARVDSVDSSAPGEWSITSSIDLGPSGDFDGDGDAETIIERHFHGARYGSWSSYHVRVGGTDVTLPGDRVFRNAAGPRDGILRMPPFATPFVGFHCPPPVTPDDDCSWQPPAGYYKDGDPDGTWDWEHAPPQIVIVRGTQVVPITAARLAEIIAASATARAPLRAPQ